MTTEKVAAQVRETAVETVTKKDHPLAAFAMAPKVQDKFWGWAMYEPPLPRSSSEMDDYHMAVKIHNDNVAALEAARGRNVEPMLRWIAERLAPCGVSAVYGILHDMEEGDEDRLLAGETSSEKPTNIDALHIQTVVLFQKSEKFDSNRTIKNVAAALGLRDEDIERPRKGRYAVDKLLAYLTHIKYADKMPYSPFNVVSVIPEGSTAETYEAIFARRHSDWLRARGKISKKIAEENIDGLLDNISDGKITKRQILMSSSLRRIYTRYRSKIENAFTVYMDFKAQKIMQDMREGKFRLSVFFVTGAVGNGKTLFAEFLAANLQYYYKQKHGENWLIYDAASTNGLDDYVGEEILMLDESRADAMKAEDWLNLIENHRTKAASARFHNKTPICKVLILTCYKDPFAFFDELSTTKNEDLNQFIRRITACITVQNEGDNFDTAKCEIALSKKVEPYEYLGHTLRYKFVSDNCVYDTMEAVKRLRDFIKKSLVPVPPPFPQGWQEAILDDDDEEPTKKETPQMEQLTLFAVSLAAGILLYVTWPAFESIISSLMM